MQLLSHGDEPSGLLNFHTVIVGGVSHDRCT